MEQKDYFVGIYDPVDVRRNLLESSRNIVKSLESFDNLQRIRHDKLKSIKELKSMMNEIDMILAKLKEKLPNAHLRELDISEPQTTRADFSGQIDQLEEQLKSVEKELSKL
jgi:chromosome segregation ATPase